MFRTHPHYLFGRREEQFLFSIHYYEYRADNKFWKKSFICCVNISASTKVSANIIDTIGIIIHQVTLDNQDKIIRTYFFSVSLKNEKPSISKHVSYNIVSIDSLIAYVS